MPFTASALSISDDAELDLKNGPTFVGFIAVHKNVTETGAMARTEEKLFYAGINYIKGFIDAAVMIDDGYPVHLPFHLPQDITIAQVIQAADKYIKAHPDHRNAPTANLLFLSLEVAYPNPEYKKP